MDGEVTQINTGADDLSTSSGKQDQEVKETPMWEKHDNLLHGGVRPKRGNERMLHLDFVKKYIEVSKCLKPARVWILAQPSSYIDPPLQG